MIVNGLQRLGLLNSAGYSRAEMPLDDACSLVAPNNTGKTSLINALQFVLVADGTRMNFGEHSREASRRFYFPTNASYVLAQLQLPDGQVVIGCVGKGHSHDYEYIAYRGALDLDDFRTGDGHLVAQPQLKEHMAAKGRIVYTYSPGEFSDGLYGRNRRRADNEPNFNLFRLDHASYLGVFQTVLTRTLRLDKLSSADVKRFLLEIFKHELTDAGIDFQAAWDRAFADVNRDRAQYEAAVRMTDHVQGMGRDLDELLGVRGKVLTYRPIIDDLLEQWTVTYAARRAELQMKLDAARATRAKLGDTREELVLRRERTAQLISELEARQSREMVLAAEFTLIEGRGQLERRLATVAQERDELVTKIGNATAGSVSQIQRDIADIQTRLGSAEAALSTLDDNLFLQMADAVGQDRAATLARVAHPALLSLPPTSFALDPVTFARAAADAVDGQDVRLPGLTLDASHLPEAPTPASREELFETITRLRQSLERRRDELAIAESIDEARRRRGQLEADIKQIEAQLARHDEYQELVASHEEREQQLQASLMERLEVDAAILRVKKQDEAALEEEETLTAKIGAWESDNREVERMRGARRDAGGAFDHLQNLPHHEWVGPVNVPIDELPAALDAYNADCARLQALTAGLRAGLAEAHAGGLTKFMGASGSGTEGEIEKMVKFVGALAHEAETLERAARLAVVNVSSALVDLRRSLDEMRLKMREFNRLISQRRVSDLEVFKLELVEIPELVGAIDKLLATADHANVGQTFDILNQSNVLQDEAINDAKTILIKEGQQNNGLRLENLFRLEFKVAKAGQPVESFDGLEASASLGTTLMAKLVIGLAMLHLMRDKRSPAQAVCYLDEAATLDPANQTSLIEAAREFGFALIFASPLPLTTARYCVPIDQVGGKNQIRRQRWQLIEPVQTPEEAVPG